VAGDLINPAISSGITNSGSFELTLQKATNHVDWWYLSTYTDGTYNATVTVDEQGQTRANPPDIGMDESGGTDSEIEVGVTWDLDVDYVGLQVSVGGATGQATGGGTGQAIGGGTGGMYGQ
jgi:hypothetical protein